MTNTKKKHIFVTVLMLKLHEWPRREIQVRKPRLTMELERPNRRDLKEFLFQSHHLSNKEAEARRGKQFIQSHMDH